MLGAHAAPLSFRGDGLAAALAVIDGLAELDHQVPRGGSGTNMVASALSAPFSRASKTKATPMLRAEIAALSRFWIADGMVFGKAA